MTETCTETRAGSDCYLGAASGGTVLPDYAVPGRRKDLSGLPPAWIGVGTLDLFHDEDFAYAGRLRAAGVPCTVEIVDGAFHSFDAIHADTRIARRFRNAFLDAIEAGIG